MTTVKAMGKAKAKAAVERIRQAMDALYDCGLDAHAYDAGAKAIRQTALDVQVDGRQYAVVLARLPYVQVAGRLDAHGYPETLRLEYGTQYGQRWQAKVAGDDRDLLTDYVAQLVGGVEAARA